MESFEQRSDGSNFASLRTHDGEQLGSYYRNPRTGNGEVEQDGAVGRLRSIKIWTHAYFLKCL